MNPTFIFHLTGQAHAPELIQAS